MSLSAKIEVTQVAGIEVVLSPEGTYYFHFLIAEKQKNEIKIIDRSIKPLEFAELLISLPPKIPLALNISGKGIIHKILDKSNRTTPDKIVGFLFPNIDSKDLCFQINNVAEKIGVGFLRKDKVEQILSHMSEVRERIISCNLGAFSLQSILSLCAEDIGSIQTSAYSVNIKGKQIFSVSSSNNEADASTTSLNMAGEMIDDFHVPAFAAAFAVLINAINPINNFPEFQERYKKKQQELKFKFAGFGVLGFVFFSLLINMLIFFQLEKKVVEQEAALSFYNTQLEELNLLKSDYKEKKGQIKDHTVLKQSKSSFYTDRLAGTIGKGINLDLIEVFPDKSTQQETRANNYKFSNQIIAVKGSSVNSKILSKWVSNLEGMEWVKQVSVSPYREAGRGGVGAFELTISILAEK